MKLKYKGNVYVRFILNYIDGQLVKANLFENKNEIVVLKDNIDSITFIYN